MYWASHLFSPKSCKKTGLPYEKLGGTLITPKSRYVQLQERSLTNVIHNMHRLPSPWQRQQLEVLIQQPALAWREGKVTVYKRFVTLHRNHWSLEVSLWFIIESKDKLLKRQKLWYYLKRQWSHCIHGAYIQRLHTLPIEANTVRLWLVGYVQLFITIL